MKNKRRYLLAAALAVNILLLLVSILIAIRSRLQKQIPSAPDKDSVGTRPPVEPQGLVPLKLGSKRIALQFGTFLPQIQLTLISVIQGVALGILIERFVPVLADTGLSNIPFLIRGFGSLMILALVWYLYSAVFVTFLWPFSWWHSLPHFLLLAVEGFTCYCVSRPSGWTIGGAFMALIAAIIRFLNTQIIDPAAYEVKEAYHHDMKDTT